MTRQIDPSTGLMVVGDLPPNPNVATMRQARLALRRFGVLQAVDAALDAMPEGPAKEDALIEWNHALTVERNSNLTQTLASGLGLSDADLDELFALAVTL